MILLTWAVAGLAATDDVSRFPWRADLDLAGRTEPVRIHVPLAMRSPDDPGDGTDLLLVDGQGRSVPFARIEGDLRRGHANPVNVDVAATSEPTRFRLRADMPIDAVRITLPAGVPAARVTVLVDGRVLAGPTLVYAIPDASQPFVELPRTLQGVLDVLVVPTTPGLLDRRAPTFAGSRNPMPAIPDETFVVAVGDGRIQENGWVYHSVVLDRLLPVDRATLMVEEPVVERQVSFDGQPMHQPPELSLHGEAWPMQAQNVRRIDMGGVFIDRMTVDRQGEASDRYGLLVSAQGASPLEVTSVALSLDGVQLLVLDPGPGPHTLYAGGMPGSAPRYDLGVAAPELSRIATSLVEPGEPSDNPAWVPAEVRSSLGAPSTEIDAQPFRYRRELTGTGLARVQLPPEVVASSREDLADLRVVSEGRQVPFLLRSSGAEPLLDDVTWTRAERGTRSNFRVTIPDGTTISSVTLTTPATVFARDVTIGRIRAGGGVETLRAVSWVGRDRPGRLSIDVRRIVGDELIVTIENGDDPPLPVEAIEVRTQAWEIVTLLPLEGAALLYGAPGAVRPSYDLQLLSVDLSRRARTEAVLGDRTAAGPTALSMFDRGVLVVGVGVLALGILGLGIELLRRVPNEPAAEPA